MNIAIVDDIGSECEILKQLIFELSLDMDMTNNISVFTNPADFLNHMYESNFSVIFLDILMPDMTGISLGKEIRKYNSNVPIVLVTTAREFALDGYDIQAFDYIVKPVSKDRLYKVMTRLYKSEYKNYIALKKNRININIPVDTILYIETRGHNTEIYTTSGSEIIYMSFNKILSLLPEKNYFAMCNRSMIVNLKKVKKISDNFLILENNTKLQISRRKITEIKNKFANYVFAKTRGDVDFK